MYAAHIAGKSREGLERSGMWRSDLGSALPRLFV